MGLLSICAETVVKGTVNDRDARGRQRSRKRMKFGRSRKGEKNSYEFLRELCVLLIRAWIGRMSSRNERERKKNLLNSVLTKKEEHSGRQSVPSNRISGLQSTACFFVFFYFVFLFFFFFFCEALRSFLCSRGRRRSRLRLVTFERPRVSATMGNKGK